LNPVLTNLLEMNAKEPHPQSTPNPQGSQVMWLEAWHTKYWPVACCLWCCVYYEIPIYQMY